MRHDIDRLLRRYAKQLQREGIPVQRVYVFGSVARGDDHTWSDIDVGVVGERFGKDRIDEMVRLRRVARPISPAISPIPLRPEDLQDRFDTIGGAIRREGEEIPLP